MQCLFRASPRGKRVLCCLLRCRVEFPSGRNGHDGNRAVRTCIRNMHIYAVSALAVARSCITEKIRQPRAKKRRYARFFLQYKGDALVVCNQNTRSEPYTNLTSSKRPCISVKSRNEMAKKFRNARWGLCWAGCVSLLGQERGWGLQASSPMMPRKGALFEGSSKTLSCWRSEARPHRSAGQPRSRLPTCNLPLQGTMQGEERRDARRIGRCFTAEGAVCHMMPSKRLAFFQNTRSRTS